MQTHTLTKAPTPETKKKSGTTPFFQAKLRVNTPGDAHEQEADQVADQVMRMQEDEEPVVQRKSLTPVNSVQRMCAGCEEKQEGKVQRQETTSGSSGGQTAPPVVGQALSSGGGRPMDTGTRQFMERRFGQDFGQVRIYTGGQAAESASAIQARAYTSGKDIVFGAGEYRPESGEGKRLLAHELVHVGQQGNSSIKRQTTHSGVTPNWTETQIRNIQRKLRNLGKFHGQTSGVIDAQTIKGLDHYFGKDNWQKLKWNSIYGRLRRMAGNGEAKIDQDKNIDYTKLLADRKMEIGIAVGDEFDTEFMALHTLLLKENFKLIQKTKESSTYTLTKNVLIPGDSATVNVPIQIVIEITYAQNDNPKKTYSRFLSEKEIAIYSGHARYGTGPDFDSKKSVKENFIIGVNSALHKAGKLKKGYDREMNAILKGAANSLEEMSNSGQFDPNKYQVWFMNACTSANYLDEIRNGLVTDKSGTKKSRTNLRFVGTNSEISTDAVAMVQALIYLKSMDEIIAAMNASEDRSRNITEPKQAGKYFFAD